MLAYPGLRALYVATLLVTGGQWIQNVVLAAYAYDRTGSARVVGLVVLAQLGPLFVCGAFTGAIADVMNRRTLLRIAVSAQAITAALVAAASSVDGPVALLIVPVIGCGIAQTLFLSAYTSLLPLLVPPAQLRRALALNAALLSSARVLGPAAGAVLYAISGQVLPLTAVAVLYLVVVVATGRIPPVRMPDGPRRLDLRSLGTGFVVARRDAEVRRILVTIAVYSLICLPFLNQMPSVAEQNFHLGTRDGPYSLIFVAIGLGSLIGGLTIGTLFVNSDIVRLTRRLLWVFGLLLAVLAVVHSLAVGLLLMLALGLSYFGVITSLITRLQIHLDDAVRGRVMALWFMGFGGILPVGAALAGPLIDHGSVAAMLLIGAATTFPLGWYAGRASVTGRTTDVHRTHF